MASHRLTLSSVTVRYLAEQETSPAEEPHHLAEFPFAPHVRREGEPVIPDNFAVPDFLNYGSELWRNIRKWKVWADQQSDWSLLNQDYILRETTATEIMNFGTDGAFSENERLFWHRQRYQIAERMRAAGQGDILDKYWPNNPELRTPPNKIIRHWER